MLVALEAVPISDLKTGPGKVVEKIKQRPVLLTQNGRSLAVLVSPEEWNRREEQLAQRRFSQVEVEAILQAYRKEAEDRPTISGEELKAQLAQRYGHVANKV